MQDKIIFYIVIGTFLIMLLLLFSLATYFLMSASHLILKRNEINTRNNLKYFILISRSQLMHFYLCSNCNEIIVEISFSNVLKW